MSLRNMLKICLVFWKSEPQYAYKKKYLSRGPMYPITPHISTCAYSKDNQNFAIFHREKATDISTCAYVQPSL